MGSAPPPRQLNPPPALYIPLLAMLTTVAAAAAEPALREPYTALRSQPATFQVDFRVAVTPPANTEQLRVWLPLPSSDEVQQISKRHLESFPRPITPAIHTEPVYGNTFAYFEFDSPAGAQLITHRFEATIQQLDWNVDYALVETPEPWPESFDPYRKTDRRAAGTSELKSVLNEIAVLSGGSSRQDQLLTSMRWIDANLQYDHSVASLRADPLHALIERRGHCSDYHGLCGTLAREVGYPSRITYGLQMFDKASPSHCKLEIYLPPFGWVSYDLSETQKLTRQVVADTALTAAERKQREVSIRERTMRGFRENTWLLMTRGSDYALSPPTASGPVPVVRTIYAEADGEPLPDPDPSDPDQHLFSWMTLHRVDGDGAAKPFDVLP